MNGHISQLLWTFSDIKELKLEMKKKDEKIEQLSWLSKRVDELKQYAKKQSITITGFKTSHKNYARTVHTEEENDTENTPETEKDTLKSRVINIFTYTDYAKRSWSVSHKWHTLPSKDPNKKPTVVRFVSRSSEDNIMRNLTETVQGHCPADNLLQRLCCFYWRGLKFYGIHDVI